MCAWMHVATLLAAFSMLINLKTFWSSTLITCFQPWEETVTGARSMVFWMMESPCQSKVIQIHCRYADAPIMAYTNEQTTAPKDDMVSDKLIPPSSNLKIYLVHPLILQPPTPDDNDLSLLSDRESFILKLNRFICFIMLRGWWVISLVILNILYGAGKNEDRHNSQTSLTH